MRRIIIGICLAVSLVVFGALPVSAADEVGEKTQQYFSEMFAKMKIVADQHPNVKTYRELMRPVAQEIPGFYDGSFLDFNWVIRQTYRPSHSIARGYDLKKVKELTVFIEKMKESPGPQLSEPAHGSLIQPRLISLRYPVMNGDELEGILSMFLYTKDFFKNTGLDEAKAYRITCLGKVAEERGTLSEDHQTVQVNLPSTEWVIEYDK